MISNVIGLLRAIPEDVRTTLVFENVNFEPYNAQELRDIIGQRVALLSPALRKMVPDHVLEYMCAKGAREADGNARLTREALLKCFLDRDFSYSRVDRVFDEVANQDWVEYYNSFTVSEKRFLTVLLDLHEKKRGQTLKAKELHSALPELSPQRVSNLITKFENEMVIETRMINAGRGGRYRTIKFSSDEMAERLGRLVLDRVPPSKINDGDPQQSLEL